VHWCLGVFSSGSTWLFNTVRKCAAEARPDRPVVTKFVYELLSVPEETSDDRITIVKSHYTEAEAEQALRLRAAAIWISVRDPRDCVASMIRYGGYTFADAVDAVEASALSCARVASDAGATVFRYEDGFIEDIATLDRIADGFRAALSPAARQRIHEEMQRSAIERFIDAFATMPTVLGDVGAGTAYDDETHWHTHHANRSGEIGRWHHELSGDGIVEIETRLAAWMQRFGYDPSAARGRRVDGP
jgi:hypothetical protein